MVKIKWRYWLLILVLIFLVWFFSHQASLDRNWREDLAIAPEISMEGSVVNIKNIRNFSYAGQDENQWVPGYYNQSYNLDEIKKGYFIVEPFSSWRGPAHTFLSFEFEGNKFISISVEARKEKGENYHPFKGLLRQYELVYIIADERDVVKLRTNFRKDKVYMFPLKAGKEKLQALFLDMASRADKLGKNPEFYNSITSTCTTNLVDHVNKITPKKVPFSYKYLLPAYSDELAFDLGLIDTDLNLEQAKEKYLINDLAEKFGGDIDFSVKIRGR